MTHNFDTTSNVLTVLNPAVQQVTQTEENEIVLSRQPLKQQHVLQRDDVTTPLIHQLFEEQVQRTPEAIALTSEQESLSYQTLNHRANQLAHYLRASGVGPGTLVGLCLERSVALVISVLAVLKAGAGYVPLDPTYPAERLTFMMRDAQVDLLLTQCVEHLSEHPRSVLCLAAFWELIARESTANLSSSVSWRDIAYVIYTSGSTGRPKGVIIEHAGLCNMITAQIHAFGVQADHRIAQFASFSFDASVSEMFLAFLAGAHLFLIPQARRWPAPVLLQYLQDHRITTITLPPSVLAVLPPEELPALHTIISAGEALSSGVAARWSTGRQVFNAYGPTEVTVCVSVGRYHMHMQRPSLGSPLSNTQIYLLDNFLQPASPGTVAEIYLGGIGVARGYLNRPDLTAEKFLPDPFSLQPGARLYKTGDLARLLPDGSLEYGGRIDRMVKMRGFRIELEEIEAVLKQHPLVAESRVIVYKDGSATDRLLAYVLPHPQYEKSSFFKQRSAHLSLQEELVHFLQEKLPKYMRPTAFVILDAFPLTVNGKIDYHMLPLPDHTCLLKQSS